MSKSYISPKIRKAVAERAEYRCEYCRSVDKYDTGVFVIDHIIPEYHDGKTVLANLAYACNGCNNAKHYFIVAVDVISGKEVALFHPRIDD